MCVLRFVCLKTLFATFAGFYFLFSLVILFHHPLGCGLRPAFCGETTQNFSDLFGNLYH